MGHETTGVAYNRVAFFNFNFFFCVCKYIYIYIWPGEPADKAERTSPFSSTFILKLLTGKRQKNLKFLKPTKEWCYDRRIKPSEQTDLSFFHLTNYEYAKKLT